MKDEFSANDYAEVAKQLRDANYVPLIRVFDEKNLPIILAALDWATAIRALFAQVEKDEEKDS